MSLSSSADHSAGVDHVGNDHQRQQQDHDGPAAFPYLHVNNIAVTYKSRNDRFITNVLEDLMHRHVNNIDKNYTIIQYFTL